MLIVAFTHIGGFIKQTRGSVMDVMNEEYVKTAKAKGLSYPVVVGKHMLRNAALPICANIALSVPTLVGGSIVIERIFSWPGLGNYLVTCLLNKDIPVVMGIVSLIIIVVLVANLVLDLVYAALDPRSGRGGDKWNKTSPALWRPHHRFFPFHRTGKGARPQPSKRDFGTASCAIPRR